MKKEVVIILKKALDELSVKIKKEEISKFLEIPPTSDMGDYAFPCFVLSSRLKKNPNQIAVEIWEKIGDFSGNFFEDIQTSGAYVNFFINRKELAKSVVSEILTNKEGFGRNNAKKEKIMIEFSQPNTHKAFHVGHIRGTSIGESLSRISEFCGKEVIRANYSGDTGMHIAKWIWGYKKYHSRERLKDDESWITSIYVDAVKKLGKSKKLQKEVDEINRKLCERSDKKITALWKKTRKLSINSWKKIYKELNTFFNVHYFESEVESKGKIISNELLKKGIAIESDGAVIMDLKKFGLGVWVLLRKDGTVLYSAKDLALAEEKIKKYNLNKSIVVTADEQDLHFRQFFKTLELMNFKKYEIFKHLSFGVVRLPTGKMSSRTGNNILYSEFISEILDYAKKRIKKREPKISKFQLEKRSLVVSIAAIKYAMLKQSPNKVIIFKKEDALNFEGDTGPYILYSYARANSILKKIKKSKNKKIEIFNLEKQELDLIKKLSIFPDIVLNSYKNLNPPLIANYSYQLSKLFNEFYHACPVIKSQQESFRIALVQAFKQVLGNSLNLLGIEKIDRM